MCLLTIWLRPLVPFPFGCHLEQQRIMPRLFHITYFSINCYSVLLCVCWQVWRHNIDTYCTLQCYLQVPGNVSLVWHVPSLHLTRWTHSGAHCCHPVRSVELSGPYYAFIKSSTWGTWMRHLVDIFIQRPRCFHNYQRNFCWTILLCNLLQICIFLSYILFSTRVHASIFSFILWL